jgi:hypothetical protein
VAGVSGAGQGEIGARRPEGIELENREVGGFGLVEALVERVELRCLIALEVVPPIAHEVPLIEDTAARAEKGALGALRAAHVEDLRTKSL